VTETDIKAKAKSIDMFIIILEFVLLNVIWTFEQILLLNKTSKSVYLVFDEIKPLLEVSFYRNNFHPKVFSKLQNLSNINFLKFKDCISVDCLDQLLELISSNCNTLKRLDLSDNWINANYTKRLSGVLRTCTSLNHLDLSCNRIRSEGATELAEVLSSLTSLNHLDLRSNKIKAEGAESLASLISQCPFIKHFDLSDNNIGIEGTHSLVKYGVLTNLNSLNLSYNWFEDQGNDLIENLKECTILTNLSIADNNIDIEGVKRLGRVLPYLTRLVTLNISGNRFDVEGTDIIAGVLRKCTTLTHLDFSSNYMDEVGSTSFAQVFEQCISLVHINLGRNLIKSQGATSLAGVLGQCTALSHLDLSDNMIEADGIASLALALICSPIKYLNLSCNLLGSDGAESLASVLVYPQYPKLVSLDLCNTRIGPNGAASLARVLVCPHNLLLAIKYLNLCNNGIGLEMVNTISSMIEQCSKLQTLDLSYNED
jgi:Ran GTPase-activating protein (RanGAP) involved in mRNA processing and transport